MSWRLDNRRRLILMALAVTALLLQALLESTRAPVKQRDYELKIAAAELADRAFAAVRTYRRLDSARLDLVNDPAGTGLIGPEFSLITNARGDLEAKLTSLNPNFAGLLVQFFRQAGLKSGDPVAVAVSGSFPGLNICLYAACEVMHLRPVVITSVGASMWGANSPDFTWLDMETLFFDQGIFSTRSRAATFGGGNDMGRGLSPEGRQLLQEAIERNHVPLLSSANIEDAITRRMAFYEETARGRQYRLFVNIGGGVASIGSNHSRLLIPSGLSYDLGTHNWPRKGTIVLFSEKGVPVLHLLRIAELARDHGLPVSPDYLPEPGEGEIFVRQMYRLPLVAGILVAYCLLLVMILAPEIRRGLFDRLTRQRGPAAAAGVLLLASLVAATTAEAETKWTQARHAESADQICLSSSGRRFTYEQLKSDEPVIYEVIGPRRLKLVSRYVAGDGEEAGGQRYTVIVRLDDREVLRKTFRATPHPDVSLCGRQAAVSGLRRAYLDLPKGHHRIAVTATTAGTGRIASRLFRESRTPSTRTVPFAPEQYSAVATLQFESGAQSTYYLFDLASPLGFTLSGPATLHLYTRLDFDKTMNGSQEYSLEVMRDGASLRTYHFHTDKNDAAFYPDRPDLVAGQRKKLTLSVPSGTHRFEVRCLRPETCCIAAQLRLPRKDLEAHP